MPHGRYRHPRICNPSGLAAAAAALKTADIRGPADFADIVKDAAEGDFVYFDPPYHPLSATSSFTAYTSEEFVWQDQLRLKESLDELAARGVAFVLSNSSHPDILGLYRDFKVDLIPVRRAINSKANGRGPVLEALVTNRECVRVSE